MNLRELEEGGTIEGSEEVGKICKYTLNIYFLI